MTDPEFIDFCYDYLLDRKADEGGKAHLISALAAGTLDRGAMVTNLLLSPECQAKRKNKEGFPVGHFYSAVPSYEERTRYVRAAACEVIPGVDLRYNEQVALCRQFLAYYRDCPWR